MSGQREEQVGEPVTHRIGGECFFVTRYFSEGKELGALVDEISRFRAKSEVEEERKKRRTSPGPPVA